MQTKIKAFFKPQNPQVKAPNKCQSQFIFLQQTDAKITSDSDLSLSPANKNSTSADHSESTRDTFKNGIVNQCITSTPEDSSSMGAHLKNSSMSSKIMNNKRSYAQLHLDLGQSDFLLRSCSTCGFKYACGDAADEKLHKELHKEYTHGIQFKGWQSERVVSTFSTQAARIVLVLDGDPPVHKKKVEKVLQMMEVDLGSGSLVHKLCKVYLFISQRRIAGCLVVEPISEAYKVLSKLETPRSLNNAITKRNRPDTSILQFGKFNLQREATQKFVSRGRHEALAEDFMGAVFLDKEAVAAVCGIRAIWVVPAMRRQQIATQLLDAARMTFSEGIVLDSSQLAFSDPTSTGKALASRYCGTPFLAYRAYS